MGQVLHGSARTTEAVRRAIQHSQESLRALGRDAAVTYDAERERFIVPSRDPEGSPGWRPI